MFIDWCLTQPLSERLPSVADGNKFKNAQPDIKEREREREKERERERL